MNERRGMRGAWAAMAAVAGVGYASGHELVLFFAQTGWAAWVGIPVASAVFGLLTALAAHWAARSGADSFAGMCRRLSGGRARAVAGAMDAVLLTVTAALMLRAAGEAGALALPLRHGALWGAALATALALLLNGGHRRGMAWAGAVAVTAGLLFYGGLALDPRPPRVYLRGDVSLALEGNVPAALLLALTYGAMNAALAAGMAARAGRGGARPARLGALCGGMLCALLLCANAAIVRGGRLLLAQALPTVILAARWGLAGFWICVGFGFLCATATLAAALGGLIDLARERAGRAARSQRKSRGGDDVKCSEQASKTVDAQAEIGYNSSCVNTLTSPGQ